MIFDASNELPFLVGAGARRSLAVALVIDGPAIPGYLLPLLRTLLQADFIKITDILVRPPSAPSRSFRKWPWLLRRIDHLFGATRDPRELVPLPPEFSVFRHRDYKDGEAVDGVDVMLYLGGAVPRGHSPARWGSWWLHYGTGPDEDEHPPYLREILAADSRRLVTLKCTGRAEGAAPEALCRLAFAPSPLLSYMSNLAPCLNSSWYLPLQKLWELSGWPEAFLARSLQIPLPSEAPAPSVARLATRLCREAFKVFQNRVVRPPSRVEWHIGVRRSGTPLLKESEELQPSFHWLTSTGPGYWADPFLLERDGSTWIFFEEMDEAVGHGHISCGRLNEADELVDVRPVLKRPFHLSYPQLIRQGDEVYLLPEAAVSGRVILYRASRFPWDWEEVSVLLELPCVDTTVFSHGDAWWMFTSPMFVRGHAPATWLYRADSLHGPWHYHPSGPVSSDARWARGAGNVFIHEGRLIRPSQDCSSSYGSSLNFNEVIAIGEERFHERPLRTVTARGYPGLKGIHTYNRLGDLEVVDGLFPKKAAAKARKRTSAD